MAWMQTPGMASCAVSLILAGSISSSRALHEHSCAVSWAGLGVKAMQLLSCARIQTVILWNARTALCHLFRLCCVHGMQQRDTQRLC